MLAFSVLLMMAAPLGAQTTTSTIQGTVSDDTGVLPGATVVARGRDSGFQYEAVSAADGTFTLAGLRPGMYDVTVTMPQYKPAAKTVEVLVGQTLTVAFRVTPDLVYAENVQVVGSNRLVETRTSEVSTNVTQEQVRYLPQDQRNFLNFAALAPGVTVTDNATRKQVQAGGLGATQINVFIDGVSYKNDVLDGGVVGQDSSRGSPFPQNAVQEFQVLTQNYKAEHEKASSAVITAVTKSGGNRWSGDGFVLWQNKSLVAQDFFARERHAPKVTYDRFQPGLAVGGPILPNRFQVFGSYEENRQNRDARVTLGGASFPSALNLQRYEGVFRSPFRERLLFAKASHQPRASQMIDVSYSLRNESDIRDFGNQRSFETATNVRNRVDSVLGRYQVPGARWMNEATITFQQSEWNPVAENANLVGVDYAGIIRAGGQDTSQDFVQRRVSLRNDHSRFLTWRGTHTAKAGAVVSLLRYDVTKTQFGNPLFKFRSDNNFGFPFQAQYGVGNPDLSASNTQFGWFVQDDWAIDRLTINAGLRWDFESDMLNNSYVTPDSVRTATARFVDASRYFTDGSQRPPFYGAWQPRVGLAYDVTGRGRHVVFGGYGRYYDRVVYNFGLDERYRLQYAIRNFYFSPDGSPVDGNAATRWDPSFFSKAGLDSLIARGLAPNPEVFLIDNNTKPPVSDQFNAGGRTSMAGILLTANYAGIRARNGFTFLFGNRRPDGACCQPIPGFSNILKSSDAKKNWYDALYLTVDRPFTGNWGFNIAYTLSRAEAIGGDLFSLDYPTVEAYPRHPTDNDERNRMVATGIVGLPADFVLSTFVRVSSGVGYTVSDFSRGFGPNQGRILLYVGRPDGHLRYRTLDLRVEKLFRVGGTRRASVAIEGFNLFNYDNFTSYEGFMPPLPEINPKFGKPQAVIENSTRRAQFGIRYSF
jgi:hypothetical protein